MAEVPGPLRDGDSAHLQGMDFAGKTGSAQTISNTLKAKLANGKQDYKDNGWFVGSRPRRNPEMVVGVLFEGGEHGQLAARLAAQVMKAYVDKQRRQPVQGSAETAEQEVEIGLPVWSTNQPRRPDPTISRQARTCTVDYTQEGGCPCSGRSPRAYDS